MYCSQGADLSQESLAKFGYKPSMKVKRLCKLFPHPHPHLHDLITPKNSGENLMKILQ
jgi:hypothetical protein